MKRIFSKKTIDDARPGDEVRVTRAGGLPAKFKASVLRSMVNASGEREYILSIDVSNIIRLKERDIKTLRKV